MIDIEVQLGDYIFDVCKKAAETANLTKQDVRFCFNGTTVDGFPGESAGALLQMWNQGGTTPRTTPRSPFSDSDEVVNPMTQTERKILI